MEHQDVTFLKNSEIGDIITQGLSIVYQQKPQNPIDYLAKWLLNFNEIRKKENEFIQKKRQQKQVLNNFEQKQKQEQDKIQKALLESQKKEQEEKQFLEKIFSDKYLPEQLQQQIPNFLKQRLNQTACYISILDYTKKPIDELNDSDLAHLDTESQKLLQYIGASDNHQFMISQSLHPNAFTYKIFENQEDGQQTEFLFVPDITQEPKLHFFQIPKLGSYMAVALNLKNFLVPNSFDNLVQAQVKYNEEMINFELQYSTIENSFQEKLQNLDESSFEYKNLSIEKNEQLSQLVKPNLPSFTFEMEKYIISIDTLGQDRVISQQEREYLISFSKEVQKHWEQNSKSILQNDVDRYLQYKELEQEFPLYVKQEEIDELSNQKQEIIHYTNLIMKQEFKEMLGVLSNYRVFKNIKGILFLLGYKKEEINISQTNQLNWKYVKNILLNENFPQEIVNYNYEGPKEQEFPIYAKIKRLQKRTQDFNNIQNYNQGFAILYKWFQLALFLREQNIQQRREEKIQLKQERQFLIEKAEERRIKKIQDLNNLKENMPAEDLETFSFEQWDQEWEEQNQQIIIPDEVFDDVDNDIE